MWLVYVPITISYNHANGTSASRCVPVYAPAFAGTRCTFLRTDGQAELTWVSKDIV